MSRVPPPGDHDHHCEVHHNPAMWQDAADDQDRIVRRVHAALNSGQRDAVIAVVLDETSDARKTLERIRDLAAVWASAAGDQGMTRPYAAEVLRQVLA